MLVDHEDKSRRDLSNRGAGRCLCPCPCERERAIDSSGDVRRPNLQLDDDETGWVVLTISGGSALGPADWPHGKTGGGARVHETREVRAGGV